MPAPKSVIRAGAALIKARRTAVLLATQIDEAIVAIGDATNDLVESHQLKHMQAGEALVLLRQAQTAPGLVMQAHDSVRKAISARGVEEPTDDEIVAVLGGVSAASIR